MLVGFAYAEAVFSTRLSAVFAAALRRLSQKSGAKELDF